MCVSWSLTLREEHRLGVFENRLLRRIFGPKRQKVAGSWRRLYNEELHNMCTSLNIIREIKSRLCWMGRACSKCLQHSGWKTWRKDTTWKT